MSRAQISTFLIVGIVILLGILGFLLLTEREIPSSTILDSAELSFQSTPVGRYVQECLQRQTREGILLLGLQGGEIFLQEDKFIETSYSQVRFGYMDKQVLLPTRADMALQLDVYLESNMQRCLRNFEGFPDKDIILEQMSFSSSISDDTVRVEGLIPLTIREGESSSQLEKFTHVAPVPLGRAHSQAQEIAQMTLANERFVDTSVLYGAGFHVDVLPAENALVYALRPKVPTTNYEEFSFLTAMQIEKNNAPRFAPTQNEFRILTGQAFEHKVQVFSDDGVTLKDDAFFFDIAADGTIAFTPVFAGIYDVEITATDKKDASSILPLRFVVEELS